MCELKDNQFFKQWSSAGIIIIFSGFVAFALRSDPISSVTLKLAALGALGLLCVYVLAAHFGAIWTPFRKSFKALVFASGTALAAFATQKVSHQSASGLDAWLVIGLGCSTFACLCLFVLECRHLKRTHDKANRGDTADRDHSRQGTLSIGLALMLFTAMLVAAPAAPTPFFRACMLGAVAGFIGSLAFLYESIVDHVGHAVRKDALSAATLEQKAYVGARLLVGQLAGVLAVCIAFGLTASKLDSDPTNGMFAFALAVACLAGFSTTFIKTMSTASEKAQAAAIAAWGSSGETNSDAHGARKDGANGASRATARHAEGERHVAPNGSTPAGKSNP
ncbi:hypothetical protein [Paraburkholderia aspalathi]|uniref:hypothetical protein n=1 Tax=Paraburkholderia aspalathi TaxID=1324617 RepID=UPI0038BBDF68